MAAIFQGKCTHCGHETQSRADSSLAILIEPEHQALDTPLNKQLISTDTGGLAAIENLCMLELAHPIEDSILDSTGMTLKEVNHNGRLVRLQSVVCRECCTLFHHRKLISQTGLAGCFGLMACLIAGAVAGYVWNSFWIGVGCGYAMLLILCGVDSLFQRLRLRRFRDRAAALARPRNCPTCGGYAVQIISRRRPVKCPMCKSTSIVFRMVGIS